MIAFVLAGPRVLAAWLKRRYLPVAAFLFMLGTYLAFFDRLPAQAFYWLPLIAFLVLFTLCAPPIQEGGEG